jgi:predicted XRE-type DNA-binding protein
MNPYKVKIEELKESQEITNEKELLKLELISEFLRAIEKMDTKDVYSATGIHKSDLSRLRALNIERFTIDRIVGFLDDLGFSTRVNVKPKKKAV